MTGPTREHPIEEFPDRIRVLHVDDDDAFVDLTASFLTRVDESFSVTSTANAESALERVEEGAFDCIVSDYEIPDTTGLELLKRVREFDPTVPFVLFTGKGSEEIASKAISAGVTDYLQKEAGTEQYAVLANRIRNAVAQSRSREALAESQKRLSRFIEQSPLGTIEFDEAFRIVRVNEAATEITGYEAPELVGGTWLPIVPDEGHRQVAEIERQLLEDRGGYQSVNEIVRKDGERRLTSWYNRVVTDDDGDVISIFSQFEDVTEDRERRRELERTNAVRSTLFETLPVGVLAQGADRAVIRANDRLFELLDLPGPPEAVVGTDCEAFVDELSERFADPEGFAARIAELAERREPAWNDELVLEDGRTLEQNYRPIELPDGQGHLWVYYDVTEREAHERRLESLNETARELMAAETREKVAEIGVDAAHTVLGLEASAIHLYREGSGLVPVAATEATRELVGELPTFTGGDSIAWRAYERGETLSVDDVREDPDNYNPETSIRSELHLPLDEYGIFIAGSPTPDAFDAEDVVLGEILAITIVTALEQVQHTERLRERERELTRQNARLEEFASVVSHDLRNPLNVAQGRLDLAMEECDSGQLERVARAHDRMAELIGDLLTLAREREPDVEADPIPLRRFVEACWRNVVTEDATLVVETDQTIRADETQLRQLFENLLRNAVEHSSTSPRSHTREDAVEHSSTNHPSQAQEDAADHPDDAVVVRVGALADGSGFYVEDDGPGIPAEERDHVFEYGYSASSGGTGLGLSIVQQCVESHGWEIRVTEGADGGARFEIGGVDVVDARGAEIEVESVEE